MKLIGNVALVTGAGQGIGKATARLLAENGATLVINDMHEETATQTCLELNEAGHRAIAVAADVGDPQAVDGMISQAVAQLGEIDILVNNAAAPAEFVPFEETSLKVQNEELLTFLGVLHCTRRVLLGMIPRRQGRIISISSIGSRFGAPGRAIYSAAKAGIEAFSRALSAEVGQHGITVNCVSPGPTESPRFKARSEEMRCEQREMVSLDRFAEPEEIAQAVVFLAGDMANCITGTVIDVDGGFCGFKPLKQNEG